MKERSVSSSIFTLCHLLSLVSRDGPLATPFGPVSREEERRWRVKMTSEW